MSKHLIQLILLCFSVNLAFCQVFELKHLDEMVIGPDNVNFKMSEQVEYYDQKHSVFLDTLEQMVLDINSEINELSIKKRKNKKKIDVLKIRYHEILTDIDVIEKFNLIWSRQFSEELDSQASSIAVENIDKSACYDLITESKIYGQSEYILLMPREKTVWQEVAKQGLLEDKIDSVQTPAHTKWVQKKANKDCLSADPNDCLVWCLVEAPAQTQTIIRKRIDVTCSTEFTFVKQENKCIRQVSITNENPKVKFISSMNSEEIFPDGLKEVKCLDSVSYTHLTLPTKRIV